MTYNFDPDQWLDIQRALLEKKLEKGLINKQEFASAVEQIEERHQQMWKYLDGSFQIEDD